MVRAVGRRVLAGARRVRAGLRTSPGPLRPGPAPASLVAAARAAGWRPTAATRAFLRDLEAHLAGRRHPRVAVLTARVRPREPGGLAALLAAQPRLHVVTVDPALGASQAHARLTAGGRFDAIVLDPPSGAPALQRLPDLLFHLRRGGAALVRLPRSSATPHGGRDWASLAGFLDLVTGAQHPPHRASEQVRYDRRMLSEAVGRLVVGPGHLVVVNRVPALAKMREDEMDLVLAARSGHSGRVVERLPGGEFPSRCVRRQSTTLADDLMYTTFDAPAVCLREYTSVTCVPQQVAVQRNLLLPDSYRKNHAPRLQHTRLQELGERFVRPPAVGSPQRLAGAYFYLDTEFPGHFGHAMTEQLSRLWAWRQAKQQHPDLRALVSRRTTGRALSAVERQLFTAAGVPEQDIVMVDSPVRVELLLAATPLFSTPDYVHPAIGELWQEIGDVLVASAPHHDYPTRVFCSRPRGRRECHNAADVEARFAAHGFTVVRPETLPLAEQATMFRQADVVAGFAGSALLNLVFTVSPKRVIVLSPESYTARNEYLICSVHGHELDVVWSVPDLPQPAGGWDPEANRSGFTFDFEREGHYLEQALASLD
ncbi:MAG TPA: glycosyltransferase 61 family protein [Nocardioidaceae bacterium]|nr:glycosyltransferase 61 family protein [Nocardioidaceae bacterium]